MQDMAKIKRNPAAESIANSIINNYKCESVADMQDALKGIFGCSLSDITKLYGKSIFVRIVGTNIEVNIANSNYGMVEHHQFIKANLDWDEYDVIVVKQGYIFPELKAKGKLSIMALTMGATIQDTRKINYKRIMRPIYPIYNI